MISDFMHLNVPDERLVDQDRRKHRRKRRQSSDRSTLKQSSAFTRAPTFTFTRAALRLCVNGLCSPSAARQLDLDWRNHPCSRHRLPYSLFLIHTNALSIYLSFSFFLSLSLSLRLVFRGKTKKLHRIGGSNRTSTKVFVDSSWQEFIGETIDRATSAKVSGIKFDVVA